MACGKYLIFITIISNDLIVNTPIKVVGDRAHRNPVPWWDAKCDKAKRLRRAALKKYKFTGDRGDFIEVKRRAAIAKKLFKAKKRASFRHFACRINFKHCLGYVCDKCRFFKDKWVKDTSSRTFGSRGSKEDIETALIGLCPPFVITYPHWILSARADDFLDSPFTFFEFNITLDSKNEGSACGMDGIDYSDLKVLPFKF